MDVPLLITGARELLTMPAGALADASPEEALGLLTDAAVAVDAEGRVAWIGPAAEAPSAERHVNLGGAVVLPGLVDAHTHLVFAGDRTADFEARCRGVSYAEIARRGGGIRLTVRETRRASVEELVDLARPRLQALLARGCTTVEIKSGYGLALDAEQRQLRAARSLAEEGPWRIRATCLAAHIVPDEHREDRARYVRLVTDEILPAVVEEGLASAADVFCDQGAFTLTEAVTILDAARDLGLALHVHGEQLTHTGVAQAAAERGALSVDHLERVDAAGMAAMARASTVAVLLPTASVFLGDDARPPVAELRRAGVPLALATDCNPGSSPTTHPWLVGTLGCAWYGLAPHEALRGLTVEAARALGLEGDGVGTLRVGGPADLAVCAAASWRQLLYDLGESPVVATWIAGREAYSRAQARYSAGAAQTERGIGGRTGRAAPTMNAARILSGGSS